MSNFKYEEVDYIEVEWDTPPPSPTSTSRAELESLAKSIAESLLITFSPKKSEESKIKKSEESVTCSQVISKQVIDLKDLKEPQVFQKKRRGNGSL